MEISLLKCIGNLQQMKNVETHDNQISRQGKKTKKRQKKLMETKISQIRIKHCATKIQH